MTVNPVRFEDRIYVRHDPIEDVENWYWIVDDVGAWHGPRLDWIDSHSRLFFKNVKKYEVVVQAGGCLGMYPRLLSSRFKTVYTFEPDPLNFFCLNMNCQSKNIYKFNSALGEFSGIASLMRYHGDNVGMHILQDVPTERIPVLRIDDIGLDECDFICLDVEGYEEKILRGAKNTIEKFLPVISCERGNDSILSFLDQFGYKIQDVSVSDTIYYVERS